MKWTTPLILVAVLALAGFAFRSIFLGTPETPREVCTRLEQVTKLPGYDKRSALRSLTLSLKHPTARGDDKLTARLLRLRADIHLGMSAYDKARSDVERMQALLEEEDVELELEAIQLQARTGQTTEALRRVAVLAERHPDAPTVSTLKGRLEAQQGVEWNEEARKLVDQYLVKEEAALAYPIVDHLCAQHTDDPRRTRLLRELHGFFSDTKAEQLGRVLDLCEMASNHFTAARTAYSRGLEQEMTIPALAALLDLLVKSGRSDLVVDLGVASRVFPEILRSPGNLLALIDAMELLGQKQRIGKIVSKWPWDEANAPREFFVKTSEVLFNAKLNGPLNLSARAMRSFSTDDLISANFYNGVVGYRTKNNKSIQRHFGKFLQAGAPGPIEGARAFAYRGMAMAWKEQNRPQKALRALQGVIDSKVGVEADDYLRLAEAQRDSSTTLPIIPEENWTRGMVLAPKRSEELMAMWEQLGGQTFQSFGQEFDRFYGDMISQKRSQPRQKVGPYTLYRIGRRHLEERRHQSALSISKALLKAYPKLVPALELRIEALQMAKNTSHLGPASVLERLRLVGADAKSQRYLSKYPVGRFSKLEQLELVRSDPYGIGRARVAQWLYKSGHPDRVLLVLRPIDGLQDPPALQALRLRALFDTDQFAKTIEEAKPWLGHPSIGQLAQRLTIRAQLAVGNLDGVTQGLRTLLKRGPRRPVDRRDLAFELIREGVLGGAAPILAQMDKRKALRSPSTIEWRGLCAAATGRPLEAQEFLTRALPFFDDGRIEFLQLIQAAGDRDWPSMPLLIQRLDESGFAPTPLQAAGIALLGERLQSGMEHASRGVDQDPNSMAWALMECAARTLNNVETEFAPQFGPEAGKQARALLMGSGDSRRDPRDVVAMLLALDMDPWQAWTEVRALASTGDLPHNQWLGWLISEAQFRSGRFEESHGLIASLITKYPLCAPLWNQRFRILGQIHPNDPLSPEVLAARADQMLAVPLKAFLSPSEITLGLAGQAMAQGHADHAISTLRRFLKISGDQTEPEARWLLGRLLAEQGTFELALDQFDRVLNQSQTRGLHPWVPEYLDWLDQIASDETSTLSVANLSERLETLVHRYPSDPLLALQRLIYRVESDERSVLLASDEALASLEMLRSLAPKNSIDELRPGSNRAWMEYLLSVSPILGEEHCRSTLDQDPGNLDMWIGLSYALKTQGRIGETRELVADLLKISDDPELHFRLAALLALEGVPAKEVRTHLTLGDKLSGAQSNSPRSRFIQAQTTLLHGTGGLDSVVRDLGKLWPNRNRFAREVPPLELGRVYLTALILRHQEVDLRNVERVADEMLPYTDQDPYSEELIRSFRAVGHAIESRMLVETAE